MNNTRDLSSVINSYIIEVKQLLGKDFKKHKTLLAEFNKEFVAKFINGKVVKEYVAVL